MTASWAFTAAPATSPVEASTPDGRSTATIAASEAFIASISPTASGRGAPVNPVPKSASTITSGVPTSVSPALASTSRTSRPASSRYRAATRPSPPLFPPPQTTVIRRACSKSAIRTSATAFPARSISTSTSCPSSARRISSAVYSGSNIAGDGDRGGELLRVRHRQLDLAHAQPLGALAQSPGQPHRRLGPAGDLDLPPGEVDGDSEAECLADRLLAREPGRIMLGRVRPRVAVRALGIGEAARAEPGVARERPPHALDLDQVDADAHEPAAPASRIDAIAGESSGNRIQVTRGVSIGRAEIRFRTSRSSGPGGQHAQKSETRVEALFDVEESTSLTDAQKRRVIARAGPIVKAVAEDERSQFRNRELALERVVAALREALRVRRPRRPTRPHREAVEERLAAKRRRSEVKRLRRPTTDE